MKRRRFLITVFFSIIIGGVFYVWHRNPSDKGPEDTSPGGVTATNNSIPHSLNPQQLAHRFASNLGLSVPQSKENKYTEGLQSLNHVRIDYYGRVVDQEGNPLPEVKVKWTVFYRDGFREGSRRGETNTDKQGDFAIVGESGKSLTVIPEKLGYIFVATNATAIYSHLWPSNERHSPNSKSPVQLMMWKLRGAEPLVRVFRELWLPTNGISVETEIPVPERSDSSIRLLFSTVGTFGQKHSDQGTWEWRLAIENGSLREVRDPKPEYVFEVPEGNYTNSFGSKYEIDAPDFARRVSKFYFLEHSSGKAFGTCSFLIVSDAIRDGRIPAKIDVLLNPNGSRNIEVHSRNVSQVK